MHRQFRVEWIMISVIRERTDRQTDKLIAIHLAPPRGQNNKKQRNVGRSNQIFWGGGLGVTQFLRFFQFQLLFSLFRLKKIRISWTPANFLRPAIASRVRCAVVEIPLRSQASVKRTGELCSSQSANELQTAGLTVVQVL